MVERARLLTEKDTVGSDILKRSEAGHFQMNKSDDFDEGQDISSMSVGGVVQGQVMVSLRMFLLIRKVRAVSSELVSLWISA